MDDVTYTVLVYLALQRLDEDPTTNCFVFSKAEFTRAYKQLLRRRLVGWRKYETLFRNLRKYAEEDKVIRYVDREKGVYRVCVSSLEADRRWQSVKDRLLAALEEKQYLAIALDDETYARLEALAKMKRKTVQDVVREALEVYLNNVAVARG